MYEVIQVKWEPNYQEDIKEIYRMFKDQERKIFDLTSYTDNTTVMDFVQKILEEDLVYLIKEDDIPCAVFFLNEAYVYEPIITRINIHCAIRRNHWGKKSREIARFFLDYLNSHYVIKKIIAEVPQCGYGVIKLLKDMGFKHEGTLKSGCLFKAKDGNPKFYDTLIYSKIREDIL